MSAFPEGRSPSLESMSVISAFSFNDNTGTTPNSLNISAQSAPQGIIDWMQGDQIDLLNEPETAKETASLGDEQSISVEASQAPIDAYPMHERFCFPAENIYFLVQGVLYSVHRYFFERDSSSFVGQGLSEQEPMVFANISAHDFDLFLSILYPTSFGVYPASTVEEWSGILHLADKWCFQSIRALSITQIAPIASPVDKIVFGRLYCINEWLTGAYCAVCTRPDDLTLEEGRRLGVDDVIRINSIRQEFFFIRVSSFMRLSEEEVQLHFRIAVQPKHPAPQEPLPEDDLFASSAAGKARMAAEVQCHMVEEGLHQRQTREAYIKQANDHRPAKLVELAAGRGAGSNIQHAKAQQPMTGLELGTVPTSSEAEVPIQHVKYSEPMTWPKLVADQKEVAEADDQQVDFCKAIPSGAQLSAGQAAEAECGSQCLTWNPMTLTVHSRTQDHAGEMPIVENAMPAPSPAEQSTEERDQDATPQVAASNGTSGVSVMDPTGMGCTLIMEPNGISSVLTTKAHGMGGASIPKIDDLGAVSIMELSGMSVLSNTLIGGAAQPLGDDMRPQDEQVAEPKTVGPEEVEQEKQIVNVDDRHANVRESMTYEERIAQQPVDEAEAAAQKDAKTIISVSVQQEEDWSLLTPKERKKKKAEKEKERLEKERAEKIVKLVIKQVKQQLVDEANGVSTIEPTGTSVLSNSPDWAAARAKDTGRQPSPKEQKQQPKGKKGKSGAAQLTPKQKKKEAEKEAKKEQKQKLKARKRKELADMVEEVTRQYFFDRANGVATMEPISMRTVSESSTGASTQELEDWSHLTKENKRQKQMTKEKREWFDKERAELLTQVKERLANEVPVAARSVMAGPIVMSVVCN